MSQCFSQLRVKSCLLCFVLLLSASTANAATEAAKPFTNLTDVMPTAGKVLSIQQGGGYSFIEVQLASNGSIFVASPILPNYVDVGTTIVWEHPQLAKDYYSHALERTFTQLYMVKFKQVQIESGIIESMQTIGDVTYLGVNNHEKQLMLLLNKNQKKSKFLKGALIEWKRAASQPHIVKSSIAGAGPIAVDWVRIALNSDESKKLKE